MAGNFQKRLQRLEQLLGEIAKRNPQSKCNCRRSTPATTAEYFKAEMTQTCPVHGFRQLGKIQVYNVTIHGQNGVVDRSVGVDDLVKEYERRLARHREEMLKRMRVEDDSEEF